MPDSRFNGYMPGFINNELALVEGLRKPFEARKKALEKCKDFPGELKRTYWNPTAEDDDSEEAAGAGGEKNLEAASWQLQNNQDQVAMIILQLLEGKRGTDYVSSVY